MDYRWVLRLSLRRKSGQENSGKTVVFEAGEGNSSLYSPRNTENTRSRNETCGSEARGFFSVPRAKRSPRPSMLCSCGIKPGTEGTAYGQTS
jgi:hypothetical protein